MHSDPKPGRLKIRRALLSVSDKFGIVELARALHGAGVELVASGGTAQALKDAGIPVRPIEELTKSPEAFHGRMKTLSYQVCSGILYRRGDAADEADRERLGIEPIDCVVVNFYPFEAAIERALDDGQNWAGGELPRALVEEIDIGGPTLVRAAAKNAPDVLVLTDPALYAGVIGALKIHGSVSNEAVHACAQRAWERVRDYDEVIAAAFADAEPDFPDGGAVIAAPEVFSQKLRYGENPHQSARLDVGSDSPIAWPGIEGEPALTDSELSFNNLLDLSAAYALASDLLALAPRLGPSAQGVVIVKHGNPCGVALSAQGQLAALRQAWAGDPVSAFGGVVVFTSQIEAESAAWLSERFVELVAAPVLTRESAALQTLLSKRKNLKAVRIREFGQAPRELRVAIPGGMLVQSSDIGLDETLRSVTKREFPADRQALALFGISVARALKSNAIALVREFEGGFQLVGAGQGQPNRVDALERLAIPRARGVVGVESLAQCVLVSDAFFPFRDSIDFAHRAGIELIVQPGGSLRDSDCVNACNEQGMAMAFTGTRHFRH